MSEVTVSLAEGTGQSYEEARQCLVAGVLDFTTAKQAQKTVGQFIAEHQSLVIDLSGVHSANSAGLALLIDWVAQASTANHSITFSHIPNSLRQLADVCQVDGLI